MISTEPGAAALKTPKPKIVIPPKASKDYNRLISHSSFTRVRSVLIAQPQPEGNKSPYFSLAQKYRFQLTFNPFIEVEGVSGKDFRKQKITLNEYSGIIFTSRNSIDHFFRICEELRVRMSQETKFFCTSEAIALYLQKYTQYRKRKVFFGDLHNNRELRNLLFKHKDATRFLYICAEERKKDDIPAFLSANGFQFAEAVMFRTVSKDLRKLKLDEFDLMILFSPSAVTALFDNFPQFQQGDLRIAAYGTTTADAVLGKHLQLHLMAPLNHHTSIITALDAYLGGH